jgi:hypothetical protein
LPSPIGTVSCRLRSSPPLAFFLALKTVFRPRHGDQSFGVDLLATGDAFTKRAGFDSSKCHLHSPQQPSLLAAAFEEVFAGSSLDTEVADLRRSIVVQALLLLFHSMEKLQGLLTVGI